MIIALFGQPHSGKSTIANEIIKQTSTFVNIDGDKLRELFANKDYSREGRIRNLNRASDIAHYLHSHGDNVTLSLVYPYKEARDYLNSLTEDVVWVFLHYTGERGREQFHVKDFELDLLEENVLSLNTSELSVDQCVDQINKYVNNKRSRMS
jgi:adenylylsulfate kinase-like enzyme